MDQLSRNAVVSARQMAEKMNLLGIPHTSSASAEFRQMSPETIKAMSHVAWGTYGHLRYVVAKHLSIICVILIVPRRPPGADVNPQLTVAA